MWGCGGFFPFGIFFILLLGFLIFKVFYFSRNGGWHHRRFDAKAMLQQRLINGEIDEAEYERIKNILNR